MQEVLNWNIRKTIKNILWVDAFARLRSQALEKIVNFFQNLSNFENVMWLYAMKVDSNTELLAVYVEGGSEGRVIFLIKAFDLPLTKNKANIKSC